MMHKGFDDYMPDAYMFLLRSDMIKRLNHLDVCLHRSVVVLYHQVILESPNWLSKGSRVIV